jgi:hypothetical protein
MGLQNTFTKKHDNFQRQMVLNSVDSRRGASMLSVPIMFNTEAMQLAGEKEEMLQKKSFQLKAAVIQKKTAHEEDEALQKQAATLQLKGLEEEEPLQKQATPFQLKGMEEYEPLQKQSAPFQLKSIEEDEPLQKQPFQLAKISSPAQTNARPNQTGMPDNLKAGVEALSGIAMDDVKVHYNSDKPAQLQALAYAQGTDIHIAPGQEKHLPHEAWHVVQQKQGRVRPTMQMKGGVAVNDDKGLESEADVMGEKAMKKPVQRLNTGEDSVLQEYNNTRQHEVLQHKFGIAKLGGMPHKPGVHTYSKNINMQIALVRKELPRHARDIVQPKPAGQYQPFMVVSNSPNVENKIDIPLGKSLQLKQGYTPLKYVSTSFGTTQLVGGLLGWGRDLAFGSLTLAGTMLGAYGGYSVGGALGAGVGGAVGSVLGPLGSVAGAVIGGGVGAIGGALAGYAGYNVLSSGITVPSGGDTRTTPKSIGELMFGRAEDLAKRDKKDPVNGPLDYLKSDVAAVVGKTKYRGDAQDAINKFYQKPPQSSSAETLHGDTPFLSDLSNILQKNPLIKMALAGNFSKSEKLAKSSSVPSLRHEHKSPDADYEGLQIPKSSPQNVVKAKIMFDKLVARRLPKISVNKNKIDPISAMGSEGELYLGTVNTPGVILHELGHHLEHNLDPEEFATLHAFLASQSSTPTLRKVGYEGLLGREQKEEGYNVPLPESQNHSNSLIRLAAHGIKSKMGNEQSDEAIDQFMIAHGNSEKYSYATMVYPSTQDTEYLSTTIHYFSSPKMLSNLVKTNPLRLALFFYLANKPQYESISEAFNKKTHLNLDKLIHTVSLK